MSVSLKSSNLFAIGHPATINIQRNNRGSGRGEKRPLSSRPLRLTGNPFVAVSSSVKGRTHSHRKCLFLFQAQIPASCDYLD